MDKDNIIYFKFANLILMTSIGYRYPKLNL